MPPSVETKPLHQEGLVETQRTTHPLTACRPLSDEEIARCRRVANDVAQLEDTGASLWISPNGVQIHGEVSKIDYRNVGDSFFQRLRLHSFIFSGYRLSNLLGLTTQAHWNDSLTEVFDPERAAPDWSVPAFRAYTRDLAPENIFRPPLVMGEVGYAVDGYCVNRDVVAYQERINLMRELGVFSHIVGKNAPLILEIGAGYGPLAYYLKWRFPAATYVIVDLPQSLLFSGCYLATALPDLEINILRPGHSGIMPGTINLVSNAHVDRIALPPIDVALNTLSFAEMPPDTVARYCRWLDQSLAMDGLLFEQNFNNAHLDARHFTHPASIIKDYLARVRSRSRDLNWGEANLWKKRRGLQKLLWMIFGRFTRTT